MIVKGLRATQDRVSDPHRIKNPEEELSSPETVIDWGEFRGKKGLKISMEAETDMESVASSEKSVDMPGRRGKVHRQVLKIREEESHLGEDIRAGPSAKNRSGAIIRGRYDYIRCSNLSVRRPAAFLPSSPLRGKTPAKALHCLSPPRSPTHR